MTIKRIICGFIFAVSISFSAQSQNLEFVVKPYLQQMTGDSFRVLWETSLSGKGLVTFGEAEFNVLKPKLDQLFQEETPGTFHRVVITGLKAGENYFYQAITIGENGDTLEGPVTPIHIPDYNRMPVSFTVVGDTQGNPKVWGRITNLMKRERPSFIVHAGDMVQYGPHKDDWTDEFFKPAAELFRFYPLYTTIGNHEMNHDWFYQYLDFPDPEWFYTLKKGNVLFVFANTNKDILPGSEQYKKLEKVLAASQETWKIMVHHQPVYTSSDNSYGNSWFQLQVHGDPNEMHLKKLYETYGVDIVLNGHIHMYERTWPLASDKINFENGVCYVTVGGGGGGLDNVIANKNWYAARARSCHHFVTVNITGNHFFAEAIDTSGIAFDSWTIEKKTGSQPLNTPFITETKQYFIDSTTISIQNPRPRGKIVYQLLGNEAVTANSSDVKIKITENTTVSAYIQWEGQKSRVAMKTFEKLPVFPARKKAPKGVTATYFEGGWIALPDFDKLKPLKTFQLDSVSLQNIQPRAQDHFAVRFTGSFSIPETDVYRFMVRSFDGSKLFIDGKELINNDGIHYEINKESFIALEKGLHTFEIQYFDFVRRETLQIWTGTQPDQMRWFNDFIVKK
ncbi:MAG: metallophosphoesterase [Prolixibacteraceae bacterium]|jgi:predicted phosphodiesterase|nr:metallophosphoesterase [Prolixibacteraceae bacterium]